MPTSVELIAAIGLGALSASLAVLNWIIFRQIRLQALRIRKLRTEADGVALWNTARVQQLRADLGDVQGALVLKCSDNLDAHVHAENGAAVLRADLEQASNLNIALTAADLELKRDMTALRQDLAAQKIEMTTLVESQTQLSAYRNTLAGKLSALAVHHQSTRDIIADFIAAIKDQNENTQYDWESDDAQFLPNEGTDVGGEVIGANFDDKGQLIGFVQLDNGTMSVIPAT